MEDRDGKKPFTIPKTHKASRDVIISEKLDSRNVTELFEDVKSCALEAQFDFRTNGCKSCDTIRNPKLQKSYNEKRLRMKKEQDPVERLAFHLVTQRSVAITLANEGIHCEQLSFAIDKSLGNAKDGVHLSKRPDVLLSSSAAQGLHKLGLVVCKVLLGKGYATLPSSTNNQLPAQVNFDHHFCKIQSVSKEQQHLDDLLANSLIFCYEHEKFEPVSRPSQILPIAILWYDLTDKFTSGLLFASALDAQHRNGKATIPRTPTNPTVHKPFAKRETPLPSKPTPAKVGTWDKPTQKPNTVEPAPTANVKESSTKKYPNHLMVPYQRAFSTPLTVSTTTEETSTTPAPITPITPNSRDPRLARAKREPTSSSSSETAPLSPKQLLQERSLSEGSSATPASRSSLDELPLIAKSSSAIYIPLNASSTLADPRLKTRKSTRIIFYLESQAAKHALQQQKRLNHYHDAKSGLPPKTSYTIIPYVARQVSNEEYDRLTNATPPGKRSNGSNYPPMCVSVTDCFNFGLVKPVTANAMYIELGDNENALAYEQIEMSNALIEREKQLNSQQIRLRLREKRQKRLQQQLNEKRSRTRPNAKATPADASSSYIATGKQVLKERPSAISSANTQISSDLLDFFSHEYKTETRAHVKHLLAELVGIFSEKYQVNINSAHKNEPVTAEQPVLPVQDPLGSDRATRSIVDMELDSPKPQELCDRDDRFQIPSPQPPPLPPPFCLPPLPASDSDPPFVQPPLSVALTPTLPSEPNKVFDDSDYNARCHQLLGQLEQCRRKKAWQLSALPPTKLEAFIPTEEAILQTCVRPFISIDSSAVSENLPSTGTDEVPHVDSFLPLIAETMVDIDEDVDRSRDEFVKLLTKEAFTCKSTSPVDDENKHKRSQPHLYERRRSYEHDDNDASSSHSATLSRSYSRPATSKPRPVSPMQRRFSTARMVTLVPKHTTLPDENESQTSEPESTTSIANHLHDGPPLKRTRLRSTSPSPHPFDTNDVKPTSIASAPTPTDDYDYRRELEGTRRTVSKSSSTVTPSDYARSRSSRSRSRSRSRSSERRQHHHYHRSTKTPLTTSESDRQSRLHSTSSRSPSQQTSSRDELRSDRKRSFEYSSRIPQRSSSPTAYKQRELAFNSSSNHSHSSSHRQATGHKRFNYNHQSVSDHPHYVKTSSLPSSTPLVDYNYSKSPTRHRNHSPAATIDRNEQSTSDNHNGLRKVSLTDSLASEPSPTIKSLRMLLQRTASDSLPPPPTDVFVNEPRTDRRSSTMTTTAHPSVTDSRRSGFTDNDSETLISMLQRARNQ